MRVTTLLVASAIVLTLAGWTAAAVVQIPRECTPADTKRGTVLHTRNFARNCGPGQAVLRVGGKAVTIQGGRCYEPGDARWVYFGLIANPSAARRARGLSLVLEPGDVPGRVKVVDLILQVPGVDPRAIGRGMAVVAEGLNSGTFALVVLGQPGKRLRGSWTCG